MNLSDKVEVKNARYYNLINVKTKTALYLGSGCKDYKSQKIMMDHPNPQSLGQVWMIFQVDNGGILRPDCYQIVHTRSTLVLNRCKDTLFGKFKNLLSKTQPNEMRLAYGDWSPQQMFYLQHPDEKSYPNYLRFRSYENSSWYLYFDHFLRCEQIDPQDNRCWWQVWPCFGNSIINRSCYLQNAFSTLALDVPSGSDRQGQVLIQYPLNNRFNQRFNLIKAGKYYRISNCNSKLFISACKKAVAGSYITQQGKNDEMWQFWILQYQGKNIYLIRSALAKNLLLGIKQWETGKCKIILTENNEFGLWKIVGFLPK